MKYFSRIMRYVFTNGQSSLVSRINTRRILGCNWTRLEISQQVLNTDHDSTKIDINSANLAEKADGVSRYTKPISRTSETKNNMSGSTIFASSVNNSDGLYLKRIKVFPKTVHNNPASRISVSARGSQTLESFHLLSHTYLPILLKEAYCIDKTVSISFSTSKVNNKRDAIMLT